jgi:hypothetical protein
VAHSLPCRPRLPRKFRRSRSLESAGRREPEPDPSVISPPRCEISSMRCFSPRPSTPTSVPTWPSTRSNGSLSVEGFVYDPFEHEIWGIWRRPVPRLGHRSPQVPVPLDLPFTRPGRSAAQRGPALRRRRRRPAALHVEGAPSQWSVRPPPGPSGPVRAPLPPEFDVGSASPFARPWPGRTRWVFPVAS